MGQDLARVAQPAEAAPVKPEQLLVVDSKLDAWIRRYWASQSIDTVPADVADAAAAHLRRIEALLRPDRTAAWDWYRTLGQRSQMRNKPATAQAVARDFAALWEACGSLSVCVWCDGTRVALQQISTFWPAPAEVRKFLEPYHQAVARQAGACRALGRAWAEAEAERRRRAAEPPREVQQAKIEELRSSFEETVQQDGKGKGWPHEKPKPSRGPSSCSTARLLATYQRDIALVTSEAQRDIFKARIRTLQAQLDREMRASEDSRGSEPLRG